MTPAGDARRRLHELLTGAWVTQALRTAARLGVADQLGDVPVDPAELAVRLGVQPDRLHRLLRVLEHLEAVARQQDGYILTPLGRLLRADEPDSLKPVAELYGELFYDSFRGLPEAISTGCSAFERVFGAEPFEYLAAHAEEAALFHRAMAAGGTFFRQVPQVIDFTSAGTIVDIGGGTGELLSHILAAAPRASGVLLDREEVIKAAADLLGRRGLLDRCRLVPGDLTGQLPAHGDVYILARILHDWDDQRCVQILTACHAAMPPAATLLIIERPVTPGSLAILWDLNMMANNAGGRERTRAEYRDLLRAARFSVTGEVPLALDMSVQIACPQRP
jgi:hypothetical protein